MCSNNDIESLTMTEEKERQIVNYEISGATLRKSSLYHVFWIFTKYQRPLSAIWMMDGFLTVGIHNCSIPEVSMFDTHQAFHNKLLKNHYILAEVINKKLISSTCLTLCYWSLLQEVWKTAL